MVLVMIKVVPRMSIFLFFFSGSHLNDILQIGLMFKIDLWQGK